MKTQHTQGPWINDGLEIFSESGGFENYSVATISDRFLSTKQDEIFANANLIAAAPELLEALLACECELSQNHGLAWSNRNAFLDAVNAARAAIKKARGES